METATFFPGTSRRITLGSPTLQTSNRRICIPITMPLSGESFVGMPDWIGSAFEAVSKHFTEVSPEIEQVADLTLAFHNDQPKGELFAAPSAKVPASELRKFLVIRAGEAGDPTIELHFKAYAPFTREFWRWVGEMAGHEVYMAFPTSLGKVTVATPQQTSLEDGEESTVIDGTPTEEEARILAGDANPPADEKPAKAKPKSGKGKNGPAELKEFHAGEVAKGRSVN